MPTPKFDVDAYRARRGSGRVAIEAIHEEVINALSSRENIALWKQGISKPDFVGSSDAYSHYAGFHRTLVEHAARAGSHREDGDRFFANDLETALDPVNVERFLARVYHDTSEGDLRRMAASFLLEELGKGIKARHKFRP